MQYPSPGEENPVMSVRPKSHSYLPVHLGDYEGLEATRTGAGTQYRSA